MADARSAWNDTGERLTELGQKLKTHYEQQHGTDGTQAREEFADAAKRLGGAVQDAFEALGTAAKDKTVQADVKQVGQSLYDALGATFGQVSEDLRRSFSASKGASANSSGDAQAQGEAEPSAPSAPDAPEAGREPGDDAAPKVEPWGTP